MKIAFLNTDDFTGGAAIASLRLAKTLLEKGHEITYFSLNSKNKETFVRTVGTGFIYDLKAKFNFIYERLFYYLFKKNKEVSFAFSPANIGIDPTKYVDFQEFDIIHIHWTNFGFLSIQSLKDLFELKKPIVFTLHDMWLFTGGCHHSGDCENFKFNCGNCTQYLRNPSEKDLSFEVLANKVEAFKSAKSIKIIGCSKWITKRAKSSLLLKNYDCDAIPNPLDLDVFYKKDQVASQIDLGLDPNKKYLLFVAMKVSVVWKGFYLLQEAIDILNHKIGDEASSQIEILIVGQAESQAFDSFPFKCHLVGQISDSVIMNQIYNAADVFVTSSIQENLPNTIMESMATGTPCVGFEIGGIPEMISHKETGYLAKYKSSEDLAEGINWVLGHSNKQKLSENCIEKVKTEFSREIVAAKYLEAYRSLL